MSALKIQKGLPWFTGRESSAEELALELVFEDCPVVPRGAHRGWNEMHINTAVLMCFILSGVCIHLFMVPGLDPCGSLYREVGFPLAGEISPCLFTREAWRMWEWESSRP